ncbi:hypothetical protein RSSE_c3555 [Ralstonia solanacearum]|nr:hypothetical protein RSSE_c3555 [Ralstonia solanacearum]
MTAGSAGISCNLAEIPGPAINHFTEPLTWITNNSSMPFRLSRNKYKRLYI